MSDTPESFPLSEWRVLDLSSDIAGPYCAKLMTDLGTHVIKVESPTQPDPLRRWTASDHRLQDGEDGALFQFLIDAMSLYSGEELKPKTRACGQSPCQTGLWLSKKTSPH